MPIYMDVHNKAQGVTVDDVVQAHQMDLQVQGEYGVRYLRYWFNREAGKIFCLVEAPSVVAAVTVHEKSHGMLPDEIIEVEKTLVEAFLGSTEASADVERIKPGDLTPDDLPEEAAGTPVLDTALRTILFTDVEGSTSMTQRLGDEAAHRLVQEHNVIIRNALREHRGNEVKTIGDAFMVSFVSPRRAVECSIAIQRGLHEHIEQEPGQAIRVRAGLSAGEPVEEKQDFFGAAVQLAARACSHAQPGQILASSVIRDLCIGKSFPFKDVGAVPLKGFDEPVHLYEVQWQQ